MNRLVALTIGCVICIGFDISARQTLLLGNIYLLPCLLIASELLAFEGERREVFFIFSAIVSVVYGLFVSVNIGALLLALILTFTLWEILYRSITLPVSAVVAQILIFFNIWGVILIVTKAPFGLAQYIVYLLLNIPISLVFYVVLNRFGVHQVKPKLKYR